MKTYKELKTHINEAVGGFGSHYSRSEKEAEQGDDDGHSSSYRPQPNSPHAVHINGKKWKTFGSKSHAMNVAKKIKGATVVKEELDESLSHDYILQSLADKDINAHVKNDKVVVHPDDATEARKHLKKIGHDHLKVTIKGAHQVAEEKVTQEGVLGAISGGILGAVTGGPAGAIAGAYLGHKVQQGANAAKKTQKQQKRLAKEEVEELDEISKDLAKKYIDKNRDEKTGGASDLDITKDKARKIQNRITGFNRALDRTYSRKDVKGYNEEVEELDEEKIPVQHVTDSVTKVLGTKGASKFLTHLKLGTEKHTTWNKVNNALMDQGIKTQHIASIATHVKPAHFKEEVEELDEIKLATVGKIIKHSPKIASAAIGAAVAAHSAEPPKQPVKTTYSQFVKKVQKEEVELDEVLDPSQGAGEYVKDFQKSDAPQFKGKSQEKRRIMGIAAYMAAKRKNK